jgi:hypothetical protein
MSTTTPVAPMGMSGSAASSSLGGGRPILSPDYLLAHRVGIPGQKDVIWNPLYDFAAFPSGGFAGNQVAFFANQQGQGTSSAPGVGTNVPKTQFDTNLQAPNQLTLGNEFYAIGSETLWYPGVNNATNTPFGILPGRGNVAPTNTGQFLNDVWEVGNQGFKALKVGTDRYYIQDGPLQLFPPTTRLAVAAAVAEIGPSSTSTGVGNEIVYAAWSGEPYTVVPIYIQTNQLFTVFYFFPTGIALPSGQIGRIGERLRGYLIRQAT